MLRTTRRWPRWTEQVRLVDPSNTHDTPAGRDAETERRLAELEIKASFAEDLLERLNTLVFRQQEAIELLLREIARLRDQQAPGADGASRSLRDELPPHY